MTQQEIIEQYSFKNGYIPSKENHLQTVTLRLSPSPDIMNQEWVRDNSFVFSTYSDRTNHKETEDNHKNYTEMNVNMPNQFPVIYKELRDTTNKIISEFREKYLTDPSGLTILIDPDTKELDFIVDVAYLKSS